MASVLLVTDFNIFYSEETKLDQVLQETQRSRQMSNQITQRIFSGYGCQQKVLPFGEKVMLEKQSTVFTMGRNSFLIHIQDALALLFRHPYQMHNVGLGPSERSAFIIYLNLFNAFEIFSYC